MTLRLYDLAGAEADRRFSPFCWRARMALAHKGLAVETIPWRMTEKKRIAFSGQERVPVLVDGETVVSDSWEIGRYLDRAYPDRPALFGSADAEGQAFFIKHWCERVVHPPLARLIVIDVYAHLHEDDKAYFRESRERAFGTSLEAVCAGREERLPAFRKLLEPLRATVKVSDYLGGASPSFADYIVFGAFQWARCVSPLPLLECNDPIFLWRDRLLAMFNGLAADSCGYTA